jgi:hypothetical protein
MFYLRSGLKSEWIDSDVPDNNSGWRTEWFYIIDQLSGLPRRSGHKLLSHDTEDLKEILEQVRDLKKRGVTGASVARPFCCRLIQPIKDRVHPAYEYWGQLDPMREVNRTK